MITRKELAAFTAASAIGIVAAVQDKEWLGERCFARPTDLCLFRLTRPQEPIGGGRPLNLWPNQSATTTNSLSVSSTTLGAGLAALWDVD
jgi:hypothetical protein